MGEETSQDVQDDGELLESPTVDTVVRTDPAAEGEDEGVRNIVVDSPEWRELIALRREAAERRRQDELHALRKEAAEAAVKAGQGRWVIAAPIATPGAVEGVGGLVFVNGVATTDNEAVVAYCEGAGYGVRDLHRPQPEAQESAQDASERPAEEREAARVPRSR